MERPPCCPNEGCAKHLSPDDRFWQRDGHYSTLSQHRPIPRFRCKSCGRRFSRQTFRVCYRDRKPHLNTEVFKAMVSGTGIRQTARMLGVNRRTVELKLVKIGKQMARLQENLIGELEGALELHLDELETFETCRRTRPLTVPIAIESNYYFVFDARSATLPPRGKLDACHREKKERDEQMLGKRLNRSSEAVSTVFRRVAAHSGTVTRITLNTDKKQSYPELARRAFGRERLIHRRTSSKAPRTTFNPLFPINMTNAFVRDLVGRLHRRSWLASKKRGRLDLHLAIWMVYRNYIRYWKNGEVDTPAMRLGFLDESLRIGQVINWRQDLGPARSIHPASDRCETIVEWRRVRARIKRLKAG